jgi:4-aminobutyrate aminotransferase-like enzyme
VNDVGDHLVRSLRDLTAAVDQVGDVRGCGLFVGIEWVTDRDSKEPDWMGAIDIVNRLKDKGMLLSNAGAFGNVLKVRPPLVFERQHADLFLQAFADTLQELHV